MKGNGKSYGAIVVFLLLSSFSGLVLLRGCSQETLILFLQLLAKTYSALTSTP